MPTLLCLAILSGLSAALAAMIAGLSLPAVVGCYSVGGSVGLLMAGAWRAGRVDAVETARLRRRT